MNSIANKYNLLSLKTDAKNSIKDGSASVIGFFSVLIASQFGFLQMDAIGGMIIAGYIFSVSYISLKQSSLMYVGNVKTPTLFIHGENDNDVPIAESEQFYIALRDVGVPAVMVRYPREGHGLREPKHVVDLMERSRKWYEKYFRP